MDIRSVFRRIMGGKEFTPKISTTLLSKKSDI